MPGSWGGTSRRVHVYTGLNPSQTQICALVLWGPDLEPLLDPLSDQTLTQAQHTYARHRAQPTYAQLLRAVTNPPNSA
jgi:hypothetical protein